MFANQFLGRKRHWEEAEKCIQGFGEHRTKRQNSANSQQILPNLCLLNTQKSSYSVADQNRLSPCEISPKTEDSMADFLQIRSERSIAQVSLQSTGTLLQKSPITPLFDSKESSPGLYTTRDVGNSLLSGTEIYDTMHFSPGLVYHNVSTTSCNRIPTPIYSSFTSFSQKNFIHNSIKDVKSESIFKRFNRATKLHSPISEENISPSIIVSGLNDMQMSVENSIQLNSGSKGENRNNTLQSRPSFKRMTKYIGDNPNSEEIKRSFSMGYRASCEKCKMKVPGHFSHIILS